MQSLYTNVFSAEMGAALCCGGDRNRVYQEQATTSVIRAADSPPPIGKLLIFVNPNSGAGKGVKTFHSKVKGQLQKNNIDYELVITNGPNHARGIVSTREDIMDFKGIVILSGDGLVYEILNGFTERPDAAEVIPRLPLAVVPSGSGNGLLASLFASKGYSLNNPAFTNQAIMIATAPQPTAEPVNLIRVQTTSENIAAFLSIGWGLMADIDIESEKYRKTLGSNRFTVSALVRTMKLRTYKGKLSYKPYLPSTSTRQDPKSFSVYGDHIFASDDPSPLRVTSSSPRKTDPFWDLQDSGQELSLEDPVPSDWLTIDEEFVGVYAMSLSHIAQDGHFMPGAKMFDDKIYLSYVLKKDVKGKSQLVKMLLGIEKGTHVDLQFFKTVQVSAFRLEPEDPNPLLVVDGEVVETAHLQASVTDLRTVIFT